jgi:hypothetical protein
MRIDEVDSSSSDDSSAKVAALAEFLTGRAKDTNSKKQIDVDTFITLANQQGANVTRESLIKIGEDSDLFNIENDKMVFRGGETTQPDMSVDQAQSTVDKMAKRAMKAHG